ncbi:MotA/TolQ/ExbB proton channel family protein [Phenylobacterium deserti]|uniref:MotA/TolQ/ExbB proton channel domain-containing protein n=2 Tax=Phenylobacterium TaxID=20 RepID=A0A328APL6_9CAUL|nr:MotA/TolQ/ExbB proton channel family protein [Phenylobacterium deserti]RAK56537.1 hypothetical protein DJ018_00705 [Phenylobacterium deserti]
MRCRLPLLVFVTAAMAAPALAQEETYRIVPPAERLTMSDVFADAAPANQAIMAGLLIATVAAVVLWAIRLTRKVDVTGSSLTYFRALKGVGPLLGLLGASYTLLGGFMGLANSRPTPPMSVLAPGYAEATLEVGIGLFAATVAVLCERHLEGRMRRAAAQFA